MGFFSNPLKAIKGFVRDPIGKIGNDLDKLNHQPTLPPQQQKCQDKCFDIHLGKPNIDFTDKKALDKQLLDSMAHTYCVKQCGKK